MSVGLIDKTKFNYLFLLNVCFFSAYFIGLFFANDNNSILQLDSLTGFFLEMYKCDDLFTLFINCIKVVSFELLLIILFSFFAFSQPLYILISTLNSFCLGVCIKFLLDFNFKNTIYLLILNLIPIVLIVLSYFLLLTTAFNLSNQIFKITFLKSDLTISVNQYLKYILIFVFIIYLSFLWFSFNNTVLLKQLI